MLIAAGPSKGVRPDDPTIATIVLVTFCEIILFGNRENRKEL
jgi:hypothetical protein